MTASTTTRRSLLAAMPAMAAVMASSAATAADGLPASMADDPIFAAIEAYRAAEVRYEAACDDLSGDDAWNAYWRLLDTAPTTLAGFTAMFTYLAERDICGRSKLAMAQDYWSGVDGEEDAEHADTAAWLALLADAMRRLASGAQS